MKKKTILILFTLICFKSFSQHTNNKHIKYPKNYIKLSFYKKIFKKELTQKDSANFKFIKNDTLVFVDDLHKKIKSKNFHTKQYQIRTAYMSLHEYKKRHNVKITKEDSLHFRFKDNDTLILISNKDFYKNRKGVSVPYEYKDSTFLELYKEVVYLKKKKNTKMRLWKDEIKIYFTKSLNEKIKMELIQFSEKLSNEVDSLKISIVKDIENSNYIIYQTDSLHNYKYEPLIRNKDINYFVRWNRKQQFYNCKLQIDTRKYNDLEATITASKNNLFLSLGNFSRTRKLPNDSFLSYFLPKEKKLTDIDLEILKYHYSYGICKFTDLETFEDNHKRAKEAIKKDSKMLFRHLY